MLPGAGKLKRKFLGHADRAHISQSTVRYGHGGEAISGKLSDIGISDKMMKELASSFEPGNSALFVLIRKVTGDKVLDRLKPFVGKGKVFKTSLNKDKENTLRAALEQV